MEDWYNIDYKVLDANHGATLLSKFSDSPSRLVMTVYKDHIWHPWRFKVSHKNCWQNRDNQVNYMKYFHFYLLFFFISLLFFFFSLFVVFIYLIVIVCRYLGDILGCKNMEDWYNVTYVDVNKNDGAGLLLRYSGVPQLIMDIFSNHKWDLWRFKNSPVSDWSQEDRLNFLKNIRIATKERSNISFYIHFVDMIFTLRNETGLHKTGRLVQIGISRSRHQRKSIVEIVWLQCTGSVHYLTV